MERNKYDVFISYKRIDKDKVFPIKDFIERNTGYNCWIDLDGIESDAQFADIIIKAINNAEVFLFMYSNTHSKIENFEEDWTVREINFAQIKKKRIVFVNIDDSPLSDYFNFGFSTKQQVAASSDVAMKKLCADIKQWLRNEDEKRLEQERIERGRRDYVDLGLPSGLKWATCNVGANKPEEYGDYFAWGETEAKQEYISENYENVIVIRKKGFLGIGKKEKLLYIIYFDISGNPQYDVARKNWGGNWRMPTKAELEELEKNCRWEWTIQNGVNGCKVTGPNGNSIFFPAAGYRRGTSPELGTSLYSDGYRGGYWSSTPDEFNDGSAYNLGFNDGYERVYDCSRGIGLTVRPITE